MHFRSERIEARVNDSSKEKSGRRKTKRKKKNSKKRNEGLYLGCHRY
jgi:hypothetical protein